MPQNIKTTLKKFLKVFDRRQKRPKGFFGVEPRDDWKKLVIFFLILNVLIICWSGYLFWQISSGKIFDVMPASSTDADQNSRLKLKSTLDVYAEKENRFEGLRSSKPETVDPSI